MTWNLRSFARLLCLEYVLWVVSSVLLVFVGLSAIANGGIFVAQVIAFILIGLPFGLVAYNCYLLARSYFAGQREGIGTGLLAAFVQYAFIRLAIATDSNLAWYGLLGAVVGYVVLRPRAGPLVDAQPPAPPSPPSEPPAPPPPPAA